MSVENRFDPFTILPDEGQPATAPTPPNAPTASGFPAISPQAEIEALRSMNTRQVELIDALESQLLAARRGEESLREAVAPLVKKYGYGSKAGRADYVVMIPGDEFDALRRALEPSDG